MCNLSLSNVDAACRNIYIHTYIYYLKLGYGKIILKKGVWKYFCHCYMIFLLKTL